MSIKKDMCLIGIGIMGTLVYQNIKNGKLECMISDIKEIEKSMIKSMEDMM